MVTRNVMCTIATLLSICTICFYFGYINAVNERKSTAQHHNINAAVVNTIADCTTPTEISATLRQQIDARVKEELERREKESYTKKIFPDTTREFAVGALRVLRDDFLDRYDFGVPRKKAEDSEAIILYNTRTSLPSGSLKNEAIQGQSTGEIATASVSDAMENCDTLNVIFTAIGTQPDCHVLIGNFESYHINRWLRMPEFHGQKPKERILDRSLPLRHFGRITIPKNGVDEFDLPELWKNERRRQPGFLLQHFDRLKIFLENVDSVLKELKELLEKRHVVRENTVVVLTVNAGQSELLSNFICAARSRGLDTGNVLVFPTDEESYKLAQGLGVATYFDVKNLGILPSGEAKAYGDPIFVSRELSLLLLVHLDVHKLHSSLPLQAAMMYAKVLCVLYVSLLGHDVLFQDVDIGKHSILLLFNARHLP